MDIQTKKSEWLESFHQSLSSFDYDYDKKSQSCCINLVPEGLKKRNLDAYMPRVVSMGPRFIGSEDLLPMEEVKLKCMMSLLYRARYTVKKVGYPRASESLEKCGEAICKIVKEVRASYSQDMVELGKLSDLELAKIMLVDGCFLVELLMLLGFDSILPSHLFPPGPEAELITNDDVLSDLMLLENQIPLSVIYELAQTLFPEVFGPDGTRKSSNRMNRDKEINDLILHLLGYDYPVPFTFSKSSHILDLVCFYVNKRTVKERRMYVADVKFYINKSEQLKLKRCALRLLTAGVTIKVKLPEDIENALSCFSLVCYSLSAILFWLWNIFVVKVKHVEYISLAKGLDFYFTFENRKLEIEQLHITKTTKAKWLNLMALEHHHKIEGKKNRTCSNVYDCNSTHAAVIFNRLICSVDDVQFLKDKKIVVDHAKMSNQELMDLFREIALGVDHEIVESIGYIQMVDDINNFSKAFLIKRILSTVWNSFKYRQEWVVRFLNHNYNFVAVVISLCTVVQTIYAIIAYQLPKN